MSKFLVHCLFVGMARVVLYMESILLKCCDILQQPSHLSTHTIERKLKILETNPKSEEIQYFYPIFLYISLRGNCHVLVSCHVFCLTSCQRSILLGIYLYTSFIRISESKWFGIGGHPICTYLM